MAKILLEVLDRDLKLYRPSFRETIYVEGTKKLYIQEIESINYLVSNSYEEEELINQRDTLSKIRHFAIIRLIARKEYLRDKVDDSFFEKAGIAKNFAKKNNL